jgi:hypothetical protein
MGEITYQGASPFRINPARSATARAVGKTVELTVFASVVGGDPTAFQIHVPMSPDDAQQLAADLRAAAVFAEKSGG